MTCTVKSVCDEMAAESDREILLCYYNKLIDNINSTGYTNKTENDETCARTIAAKINAEIQNGLGNASVDMHRDMFDLITTVEDTNVVSNMKRSHALLWLILMVFLLSIVIYLWNFK